MLVEGFSKSFKNDSNFINVLNFVLESKFPARKS